MQSSGSSWAATGSATSTDATPTRSRFALRTRSAVIDVRIEAVRRDLADIRMADRVFAPHYAVPTRRTAGVATPVLETPGGTALSQLLPGEPFDVLEFTSSHGWGRSPIDGVVGFVERGALTAAFVPTHIVVARETVVHAAASSAHPLPLSLPMGARVQAGNGGDWIEVDGGYVRADDLRPLHALPDDPVAVALRLTGVAEVAGGRSGAGVDSAGLIFLSLLLTGESPPRFADLQAAAIGTPLSAGDVPARGDLLFFADHAAMLVDGDTAVHADGTVRCENVSALDRFGPILARRRLP